MLITKYFVNNNAITLARYVSAFNMNVRTKSVIDGFNMANFIIGISSGVYHRDLQAIALESLSMTHGRIKFVSSDSDLHSIQCSCHMRHGIAKFVIDVLGMSIR